MTLRTEYRKGLSGWTGWATPSTWYSHTSPQPIRSFALLTCESTERRAKLLAS